MVFVYILTIEYLQLSHRHMAKIFGTQAIYVKTLSPITFTKSIIHHYMTAFFVYISYIYQRGADFSMATQYIERGRTPARDVLPRVNLISNQITR